ncbi:MAG: heavy-metal-associated domain-containing protein [Alkalispirochaeta sp.]
MIDTIRLRIVGETVMHCNGCEQAVKMSLSQLEGMKTVKADHTTQLVEATVDTVRTDQDAIMERLGFIGYQTQSV